MNPPPADTENVPPGRVRTQTANDITVEAIRARISRRKNSGAAGEAPSAGPTLAPPQANVPNRASSKPSARTKSSTPSGGNASSGQRSSRHTGDDSATVKRSSIRTTRSSKQTDGRNTISGVDELPNDSFLCTVIDRGQGLQDESASPLPKESDLTKERYTELAAITEEILTYCHLLDSSRARAQEETFALRDTIRELEKLLDSARHREVNHLSYVEQQREAMATFEKRYYSLKSRARSHIKEMQEERDKLRIEVENLSNRLKNAETELATAQSTVSSQGAVIDRYREQTKNMPTEKEITQMRLQLRRLEDDNGRLATERAALMVQIDELGAKRDGQSGRPSGNRKELEDALAACRAEKEQLIQELYQARQQADEYQQYCEVLLEKLPGDEQGGNSGVGK